MPVTRSHADFNHVEEWTKTINEVPNQSGFIKSMNLFDTSYTNQEAILFDKVTSNVTLLASTDRRAGPVSYGKDDKVETFSLPLDYMSYADRITKQDYMSKRRAGTANEQDTFINIMGEKLRNLRRAVDQTHEYMMLQSIKGVTVSPSGRVLADMFSLFGITQTTIDFELGTNTTNVHAKIAQLKDTVVKNLKTGGVITAPLNVIVDRSFFDKFINHDQIRADFLNSQSNVRYQQDLSSYYTWGISDVFEIQGVRFMVYGHEFNLPNGTTEPAVETDTGYAIPVVAGDSIFRAVYGPSQRMDSDGGMEMFAWSSVTPVNSTMKSMQKLLL